MTRHLLMVDLKDDPDVVARYKEHHRRVWPEVLGSLKDAGIADMEIFMLGRRLVMVVETNGRDVQACFAAHVASNPRVAEWEALMKSMQQPAPGGAPEEWWAQMEPVFRLDGTGRAMPRPEPARRA
jgi:L-rhamnose mutarotase